MLDNGSELQADLGLIEPRADRLGDVDRTGYEARHGSAEANRRVAEVVGTALAKGSR